MPSHEQCFVLSSRSTWAPTQRQITSNHACDAKLAPASFQEEHACAGAWRHRFQLKRGRRTVEWAVSCNHATCGRVCSFGWSGLETGIVEDVWVMPSWRLVMIEERSQVSHAWHTCTRTCCSRSLQWDHWDPADCCSISSAVWKNRSSAYVRLSALFILYFHPLKGIF
jgi:hypothetical protein